MKTCTKILFWILLLIPSTIQAQTDVSIRKSEFKNDKTGLKEAWKHVEEGDSYYSRKGVWYNNAYDEYLKAYAYNNRNAELNYKTGASALFSDSKDEAAGFLLKALEEKNDVADDILLITGRALQYSGNFSDAISKLEEFVKVKGKKSKEDVATAEKWITECRNALELTKDTLEVEINNLGAKINSNADEYSQVLSPDGKSLYFASRRELPKSSNYYRDSKYDENIFFSVRDSASWKEAITAGKSLITKYCEAPVAISPAGDRMYIYAGYENGGDILMSEVNKKGMWKMPERVPFRINSKDAETSLAVSPSGNEIFFVSDDEKHGLGGKDIFYVREISERRWSKPQNAGNIINTKYNEEAIRLSKGGDTLWFSSTGHNSIGGYDLFYSVRNRSTGDWDSVRNCGYPVNTPWDELFYQQSPEDDSAFYFVSNRSGGFGGFDIYNGVILPSPPVIAAVPEPDPVPVPVPPTKPDTVVIRDTVVVIKEAPAPPPVVQPAPPAEVLLYLTGTVKDSETGAPVIARVDLIDPSTDATVATTASSDTDGGFRIRIPSRKQYMAEFRGNGFLPEMKRIDIDPAFAKDFYNLDVKMVKVKVGKKVVLNNILFESGKAVLTAGSYKGLESLAETLSDNAAMKIEISGHTDKTGSEPLNLKLSEDRSKAVVEYLVQKGIDRQRLTYKGYGSSQPVDVNTTPAGRAKNRRVEFKILEF